MRSLNNVREVVPNVRSPALVHIPINGELSNEDARTADVVVEAEGGGGGGRGRGMSHGRGRGSGSGRHPDGWTADRANNLGRSALH
jgi:hypothetical protein